MAKDRTLADLRDEIAQEEPYVDIRPYSHNIIGLLLKEIADRFGKDEANKAITDFRLERKGWRKEA